MAKNVNLEAGRRFNSGLRELRKRAVQGASRIKSSARKAGLKVRNTIKKNPGKSIAVAGAAGAVMGAAIAVRLKSCKPA